MPQIDGVELRITPAGFADVMVLKKSISDALRVAGVRVDLSGFSFDFDDPLKSELGDIGSIIEMVMSVATDPKVQTCLFKCCERALWGTGEKSEKITLDFFEAEEHRQYYYPIMIEVLKTNLSPFFLKVGSLFTNLPNLTELFQKQK